MLEREFPLSAGRPALTELSAPAHSLCLMSPVGHPSFHREGGPAEVVGGPEASGQCRGAACHGALGNFGYIPAREKSGKGSNVLRCKCFWPCGLSAQVSRITLQEHCSSTNYCFLVSFLGSSGKRLLPEHSGRGQNSGCNEIIMREGPTRLWLTALVLFHLILIYVLETEFSVRDSLTWGHSASSKNNTQYSSLSSSEHSVRWGSLLFWGDVLGQYL